MRSGMLLVALGWAWFAWPTELSASEVLPGLQERFAGSDTAKRLPDEVPNFQRHVVTLLGRLGCNGRNCHGSFQGRGGFRLSMFGYDFEADHTALTGGDHPRVDRKKPAESLILNKPTNADEHGGGLRFRQDGWEYRVLRRWIEAGATNDSDKAGRLIQLRVTPDELLFSRSSENRSFQVVAEWSDGTREVVIQKDGYDTLKVLQPIPPPWYQIPGIDFFADNLLPYQLTNRHEYRYQLTPSPTISSTQNLRDRANSLRSEAHAGP